MYTLKALRVNRARKLFLRALWLGPCMKAMFRVPRIILALGWRSKRSVSGLREGQGEEEGGKESGSVDFEAGSHSYY